MRRRLAAWPAQSAGQRRPWRATPAALAQEVWHSTSFLLNGTVDSFCCQCEEINNRCGTGVVMRSVLIVLSSYVIGMSAHN